MRIKLKVRDGKYVCPCCGGGVAAIGCPTCKAPCPPACCQWCGSGLGMSACKGCGQPDPAWAAKASGQDQLLVTLSAETKEVEGVMRTLGKEEVAVKNLQVRHLRGAVLSNTLKWRNESATVGVVEVIASSNLTDQHGTDIVQQPVLELLPKAKVDVEHNFQAVDGVDIRDVKPAQTNVDGKIVDVTRANIYFDLLKKSAKDLWQKVIDGTYKGVSIAFSVPEALDAALASGATAVIDQMRKLPYLSFTSDPSNLISLVNCFETRSTALLRAFGDETEEPEKITTDPEPAAPPPATPPNPEDPAANAPNADPTVVAPTVEDVTASLRALVDEATQEQEKVVEEQTKIVTDQFEAKLVELRSFVEATCSGLEQKFLVLIGKEVAPALRALQTRNKTALEKLKTEMLSLVEERTSKLRAAPRATVPDLGGEESTENQNAEKTKPTAARPRSRYGW